MRIVFFGSPEFAVANLEAVLKSKHQVVGVITQPDRPAGRGMALSPSAVKKIALRENLPVFQPEKLNREETYAWLSALKPDLLVVVAYGEFLGERLLKFCSRPPVNVHPSLLPDLRGAAPMQWALLRGYARSGVSTQFMVKEMDAGDVLLQEEFSISPDENAQELQDRLKPICGQLLVNTLDALETNAITPRPQDPTRVTFAPLLEKEAGLLRWKSETAAHLHNQVRGLFPWPSAFTFLGGKRCKILRSKVPLAQDAPQRDAAPGEFVFFGDAVFVRAKDSWLQVLELQPEGKRPLLPREFANGINNKNATMHFDEPGES